MLTVVIFGGIDRNGLFKRLEFDNMQLFSVILAKYVEISLTDLTFPMLNQTNCIANFK